jgi:hypothetical protein
MAAIEITPRGLAELYTVMLQNLAIVRRKRRQ